MICREKPFSIINLATTLNTHYICCCSHPSQTTSMSDGGTAMQPASSYNYDSDDSSSSSRSVFNGNYILTMLSARKVKTDEHGFKSNSPVRCLAQKTDGL